MEFCELYPSVVSRLVDLLQPIDTHKRALSDLHQSRPLDVTLRLLEAELVARNLEGFTRGAFDDGARTIGATPRIGRQRLRRRTLGALKTKPGGPNKRRGVRQKVGALMSKSSPLRVSPGRHDLTS